MSKYPELKDLNYGSKEYRAAYYKLTKEERKPIIRKYQQKNRVKIQLQRNKRRNTVEGRAETTKKSKAYREKNKEAIKQYQKEYRIKNKVKLQKYQREYHQS